MAVLSNVHEDARLAVGRDVLASELAQALTDIFTISSYKMVTKYGAKLPTLFCKPTKTIANALFVEREVLAIIANFPDIHARTVTIIRELIDASAPQLDPGLAIVVHADRNGDDKLRHWGREKGVTILPIYRPRSGALPPAAQLRQRLANELFSFDPFQVTGPVSDDIDFFGRKNDALELLRQLREGRIRSLFGIRKVGKTSLINRVISLARDAGSPRVAMVDCSMRRFNSLSAADALRSLAKVSKLAVHQGYAHISDAMKRSDKELVPLFQDLWQKGERRPLLIVFDEVDYITPDSPAAPHWREQFNHFWREFRVLVQEAQRQGLPIAVLISGVSSRCFRLEQIGGVENAALHLVPEEYLSPFARGASDAMLKDLGKRCGLNCDHPSRELIAKICGDFPFWMRMACSHIHRSVDIRSRPVTLTLDAVQPILENFLMSEGAEIAKVALQNVRRVYPELFAPLQEAFRNGKASLASGHALVTYGLAARDGQHIVIKSGMVQAGLGRLLDAAPPSEAPEQSQARLLLAEGDWAEELAVLNRRRNVLERKLRSLVRFALKVRGTKQAPWIEKLLAALPSARRTTLASLSPDVLMERLFWMELGGIIVKNWDVFESMLGSKARFEGAMALLNDRPDAHAKDIDMADVALQRRELSWLEERINE